MKNATKPLGSGSGVAPRSKHPTHKGSKRINATMRSPVGAKVFKLSLGGGGRKRNVGNWKGERGKHPPKPKRSEKLPGVAYDFNAWWFFTTPIGKKMCKVKSFPQMGMNIKKDLSCHHPDFYFLGEIDMVTFCRWCLFGGEIVPTVLNE